MERKDAIIHFVGKIDSFMDHSYDVYEDDPNLQKFLESIEFLLGKSWEDLYLEYCEIINNNE